MDRTGPKRTDSYWAGFVDADGCIRFSKGTPRIEVKSVFPYVLLEICERFGGRVRRIANEERPTYVWQVTGTNAYNALIALEPHMVVKKAQATLILDACMVDPGGYREGLEGQIAALKHHHYEVEV